MLLNNFLSSISKCNSNFMDIWKHNQILHNIREFENVSSIRYSIAIGGIFSLVTLVGGRLKLYDDSSHGSLWSKFISMPVCFVALVGLASYTCFAIMCRWYQTLIFFPIGTKDNPYYNSGTKWTAMRFIHIYRFYQS